MIEIDHTALPNPEPAIPILASNLLAIEEKQRTRFSSKGERIKTGCSEIDGYLLGGEGLDRGIVLGLSGEGNEGKLLSLNLLATVALSHLPASFSTDLGTTFLRPKMVVIDTNGSFDISLMARMIKSRILAKRQTHDLRNLSSGNYGSVKAKTFANINMEEIDQQVQFCLQMIAISRVFNIEGLWEVLGELGHNTVQDPESDIARPGLADEGGICQAQEPEMDPPVDAREVGDSEDSSVSPPLDPLPSSEPQSHADECTELVIIDNMTHIINELFSRKEKGEAHHLLITLSRSLYTLSRDSNILTILHNGTVSTKPSYSSNYDNPDRRQSQQYQVPLKSVFSSNPMKPALGRIFDQFPSLHILLSSTPRNREDAEILYGKDDEVALNPGIINHCTIVEVLKDETPNLGEGRKGMRFGALEQRWAAVVVSDDGLSLVPAFQERGNMKGLGQSRGPAQNVGSVAKLYGFGERRV